MAREDRVREILDKFNWDEFYPRLVNYALNGIREKVWHGKSKNSPPKGTQAHDLAAGAIEKVYKGTVPGLEAGTDGVRLWDPEKAPDLFKYLCSVIDSDVNHLAESFENRKVTPDSWLQSDQLNEDAPSPVEQTESKSIPSPPDALDEKWSEDRFFGFLDYIKDEEDLVKFVETVFSGVTKRANIANELGIKDSDFDNLRKRLQRRYGEYPGEKSRVESTSGERS